MAVVRVDLGERGYDVVIESGILPRVGEEISAVCRGRAALVVTDPSVGDLYAREVLPSLEQAGFQAFLATVPGGEESKTLAGAAALYDRLLDVRIDRTGVLVTLGGGVIGDLGGFVAATYMRGIDFIQIPTTLLAQVDASIGGKVAVDLPRGKNLVGAFYQPKRVLIDPDVLATLPRREMAGGLAELIKYGIIFDRELFEFLQSHIEDIHRLDRDVLEAAISRSCEIKAMVVTQDEKESGLRAILNYGHTVGHGIEAATGFAKYSHGEAVSIGMVTAALISEAAGRAPGGIARQIADMLAAAELPVAPDCELDLDAVIRAMSYDKKSAFGNLMFVLPVQIGKVEITDTVTEADVRTALAQQMKL
ncbi:MAG: 3-dehydroquinate synthase [Armatimonadetes bacterium]|nr:3-dehydroquinate synthase [Armatimonadota bacterium]